MSTQRGKHNFLLLFIEFSKIYQTQKHPNITHFVYQTAMSIQLLHLLHFITKIVFFNNIIPRLPSRNLPFPIHSGIMDNLF